MSNPVYVSLEFTPNPNTLKYSVNRTLLERGAMNLMNAADAAQKSPLAARLFSVPGICGVMIGKDFVTSPLWLINAVKPVLVARITGL